VRISLDVGHVVLNAYYCVLFSSRVRARARIRCSVRLVSGYIRVFILLSVVVVPYPATETSSATWGAVDRVVREN